MRVIDFKDASCRHCYKCVRNCEVKAISVQNEQAHIMKDHCINCGHCLEVCPQNAKTFASDMERVKGYLKQGMKTVISIAPSYLGVLEYEKPGQVVDALLKLGFYEVRETAEGAALVTQEYRKLLKDGTMKNIITTCCPSVNDLIEKYYPALTGQMAPVVSPMIAHGRLIKQIYGEDTKVVFLGPCIAKKEEAVGDKRVIGAVDAILTFEEITKWWAAEGIDVNACEDRPLGNPDPRVNKLYPVGGGIVKSILADSVEDNYYKVYVDGLKPCMELFEELMKGEISDCFFEVNVCEGGCIKGPASDKWQQTVIKAKMNVEDQVGHREPAEGIDGSSISMEKQFHDRHVADRMPDGSEMRDVLKAMGKYTAEDELNCGACGYPTCRAKAVAVYQKKAEIGMCLPHALEQAESMSNVVMDVTPSMILIVDKDMRIRECNKKAQEMLDVSREEALERYIFEFLDDRDIAEVLRTKRQVIHKKVGLESIGMTVVESIIYIESLESVLVTYQDITKEEKAKEQHYNLKIETVEMAQRVIDKQMMVAQEIAGLLGETTAETKVTLSKLRDSILFEEEGE
ncbi:[Fe-Fe] hydrogenase large subunit C-terminal domain-containing protein [[Clostridium] hylemonae]|uniref:PAS domain S-box protein n=1 Tax=[Clostridium] hylemonae DSM 15053 TaxID=553973 RepID=C0BYV3_9FIRM|nr:[Fe-Fe] hydrogenase large subunit C-terminal domain-containing protein [[Clostridium] hylemonae]EEG75031.1 PAS domain S-box protein [[Clostridium] hylemonae DSM 15053]QEK18377.1 Iron hydrogenase 1 [[Clostridium] hylemonae DSM 15053]